MKLKGVYKITNKLNGDCYVGQSSDVKTRWRKHREQSILKTSKSYKYPLQVAFRKFGIDNFNFEMLEEFDKESQRLKKESEWLGLLQPEYNLVNSQGTSHSCKSVFKIDVATLEIVGEYISLGEAGKRNNLNPSNIGRVCNRQTSKSGGFYWCLTKDYLDWKPLKDARYRVEVSKDGVPQLIFDSILECSKAIGYNRKSIKECCDTGKVNKYGFGFKLI